MKTLIISAAIAIGLAAPALAEPTKAAPAEAVTAGADEIPFYDSFQPVFDTVATDALSYTATTPDAAKRLMMRCGGPPPKIARTDIKPAPTGKKTAG